MQFKQMFVTAVCVLFLLKLKWPKSKNFYEAIHERYGHDTLKTVRRYEKDLSRVLSTFLECSQMTGVFYHSVIHGLGFLICFKI